MPISAILPTKKHEETERDFLGLSLPLSLFLLRLLLCIRVRVNETYKSPIYRVIYTRLESCGHLFMATGQSPGVNAGEMPARRKFCRISTVTVETSDSHHRNISTMQREVAPYTDGKTLAEKGTGKFCQDIPRLEIPDKCEKRKKRN